jgi:hypothetical protein
MQRIVQPGDVVQRFQRSEIMLQGWMLKLASVPATIARKASGDLAWDCELIPTPLFL